MNRYLLDTSALLALRDNEPGAERVAVLLEATARAEVVCHGCFISQMELLYRVWKDEGEKVAREAYGICVRLPIIWLHESPELLERAAAIKACFPLSLADAWIAASALQLDATLVHKDPEFVKVADLKQECLPYK
ncbi:MAG: PIN domain-containing protein [Pelobacteraceae bacterium]